MQLLVLVSLLLPSIVNSDVSCALSQDEMLEQATGLLQADAAARRAVQIDSKGDSDQDGKSPSDEKAVSDAAEAKADKPNTSKAASGASKVGINLSVKWMKSMLSAFDAVRAIPRLQQFLGLSQPIERVKTYDLGPSNMGLIDEIVRVSNTKEKGAPIIKELVIGIGNKELHNFSMPFLQNVYSKFQGAVHVAVGNEPDRGGVHSDKVLKVIKDIRQKMPGAQVTVPFAYSIMHRSHPVNKSKLEKEFIDTYKDVLPELDYFTINIYPFLSAGVRGVKLNSLLGPEMSFLNDQIAALRVALDRDFPHNMMPLAIGETGWPTCGAAKANPYAFATLDYAEQFLRNVGKWMESNRSNGVIMSGQLFTAFDEETKGTRAIERYYGILTSNGSVKDAYSCVTNATEPDQAWLEEVYPDCEADLDWMVTNFDNPYLAEKFVNRDIDGSLCSFQQYLYDRWATCPPVTRVPGYNVVAEGGHTVYGQSSAKTKCWSQRLAHKYSDRGAIMKPSWSHVKDKSHEGAAQHAHTEHTFNDTKSAQDFGLEGNGSMSDVNLQVFWINLDSSTERRSEMQNMLADLRWRVASNVNVHATRVPAITPADVKAMQLNHTLSVEATLIDACTMPCPMHHARGELLYTEVACTLSHLRAMDLAYAAGVESALILEDDMRVYQELGEDLEELLHISPKGWSALQMSTVSTKALLALASANAPFVPREEYFYGTGSYFIHRSGMEQLRARYHDRRFQRRPGSPGAGSLQAEPLLFGALSKNSVFTATHFYFNFQEFPTTVHKMSPNSDYHAVSSLRWQMNFLHRHRSRLTSALAQAQTQISARLQGSTFLAMTSLVCRDNAGFDGEKHSIAKNIRQLAIYNFTYVVYVIVPNASEVGNCPGLESFSEFRQPSVTMNYRVASGRFSKWVYYTEDVDQFQKYDFLIVYDADMGLSTFPWVEYFHRYDEYASKFGVAPVTGSVRNRSPFFPLKRDWWQQCNRSNIRFLETDLIEQWFAMLSGKFATWYLKKIVSTGIIMDQRTLGVDWGVDSTWCGAAAEWSNREAGCLLIPIDMYHGDTRSLKQDVQFHQNGEHLTNIWWERMPQWMMTSSVWLGSFFQDHMLGCSPCGLEERYHMPVDLRSVVPIVPMDLPDNRSHHNVEGLTDPGSASGSSYKKNSSTKDSDTEERSEASLLAYSLWPLGLLVILSRQDCL